MSSLSHRLLRLPVRIDRADTPVDADTGGVVRLWAGSPARLRFAFFSGDTLLGDFSGCSGVTVQLKALGAGGAPPLPIDNYLAEAVVTQFNAALTPEEWEAGTAWHAEVAFAGASLNVAAGTYWLVVVALLDQPTTLLAGKCEILQDGYGSGSGAPTPPEPPYTRAEADARYLPLSSVAPSGQDASSSQVPRGDAPKLVNGQAAYDALAPARTLVAQGKTRRLLVPGSLATRPLVDSGYDIAKDRTPAGAAEVLVGSDPRVGLRGGVALLGNTGSVGGSGSAVSIPLSGDFEWHFLVKPEWTSSSTARAAALFNLMNGASDPFVIFGFGTTDSSQSNASIFVSRTSGADLTQARADIGTPSALSGKWCMVGFSRSGSTFTAYLNGAAVAWTTNTLLADGTNTITRIFGAKGGYGQFQGRVIPLPLFNHVLTAADRALLASGERSHAWLGGVAKYTLSGAWTDISWTSSGGSITTNSAGALEAAISGQSAANALQCVVAAAGTAPSLRQGRVLRVRYTATVPASGAWLKFRQFGDLGVAHTILPGTNIVDLPISNAGASDANALTACIDTFPGTGGSFRIESLSVEILGAKLLVPPDGWSGTTSLDISGNALDVPVGTGVVPVDPKPQERRLTLSLPATTIAGVGNASGIFEADVTLTASGYSATKALAAIRAGDSVDVRLASRLPNGMLLKQGARVVSNGVVALGVLNLNGSDESTGTIACELTHIIR